MRGRVNRTECARMDGVRRYGVLAWEEEEEEALLDLARTEKVGGEGNELTDDPRKKAGRKEEEATKTGIPLPFTLLAYLSES